MSGRKEFFGDFEVLNVLERFELKGFVEWVLFWKSWRRLLKGFLRKV